MNAFTSPVPDTGEWIRHDVICHLSHAKSRTRKDQSGFETVKKSLEEPKDSSSLQVYLRRIGVNHRLIVSLWDPARRGEVLESRIVHMQEVGLEELGEDSVVLGVGPVDSVATLAVGSHSPSNGQCEGKEGGEHDCGRLSGLAIVRVPSNVI